MGWIETGTAIYLAGHGTKANPRLIELQHHRILRYRSALLNRSEGISRAMPDVFVDLHLPPFGMGTVDLSQVPAFNRLREQIQKGTYSMVYMDLDEGSESQYESTFVRRLLEAEGATVLNAFTDDRGVFAQELRERCGTHARDYEVTDGSDFVNFFPSLAGEILLSALFRELDISVDRRSPQLQRMFDRIESLKRLRPYAGGTTPFVESQLIASWTKAKA